MRIEEIVGQRIRDRREERGLTQGELGKLIGAHLGRDWSRQAVSAAEKGERAFAVAELVLFAHALGLSITQLLTPPPDVREIEVAPGVHAGRDVLALALVPPLARERPLEHELQNTFTRLLRDIRLLGEASDGLVRDLDRLQQVSMAMQQEQQEREPGR